MWLSGFEVCILCSLFGQSPEIVLYLPTYLKLPVVFLFFRFWLGNANPFLWRQIPVIKYRQQFGSLCLQIVDPPYTLYSTQTKATLTVPTQPSYSSYAADENLRILHPIVVLLTSEATSFVRIYLHPFLVPTRTKNVKSPSSKTFESYVYNISNKSCFYI